MPRALRSFALFAALALPLSAGCSVHSLLNQSERENEKTIDIVCACENVFPDRAECEAFFSGNLFGGDRDCVEAALEIDSDAATETLECSLDLLKEYNKCLKDSLKCEDPTSFEGCNALFMMECPELPESIQVELNKCAPAEG